MCSPKPKCHWQSFCDSPQTIRHRETPQDSSQSGSPPQTPHSLRLQYPTICSLIAQAAVVINLIQRPKVIFDHLIFQRCGYLFCPEWLMTSPSPPCLLRLLNTNRLSLYIASCGARAPLFWVINSPPVISAAQELRNSPEWMHLTMVSHIFITRLNAAHSWPNLMIRLMKHTQRRQ